MFDFPAFVVYILEAPSLNADYNNVFTVLIATQPLHTPCRHHSIKAEVNLLENEKPNELRAIHPLNELKYISFPKFPVI